MKKIVVIVLSVALGYCAQAQNLPRYQQIVKELSSAEYQGRGYAKDGVLKAGRYIEKELAKTGAEITLQPFSIDVNTFPGQMKMSVDGRKLIPGSDFVLREYSPGAHGTYGLYYIDTLNFNSEKIFEDLAKPENAGAFVVCDFWFTYKHRDVFSKLQKDGECPNGGLIYTWDTPLKFYKAYANKVVAKPIIWVSADFPKDAKSVCLNIDNEFLKDYESNNIIAKIPGRRHDSCFVFTAHYDHLGNLGRKVWYPGANDNASGTAAVITLAEWYSEHQPEYDMYFVAFSGEDTGLNGSTYMTEHPLFPLESIKYLFNLDMIGDNNPVQYVEVSDAGLAGFALLEKINAEKSYYKGFNRGKLAGNSDHYPFAVKGVPCILFENEEGDNFKYYHTAQDNWENAVFDSYLPCTQLIIDFCGKYL